MKRILFILVLLTAYAFNLPAQNEITVLQNKVTQLEASNAKLLNQVRINQKAITDLTKQLTSTNETLKLIQADLEKTQTSLQNASTSYDERIAKTEKATEDHYKQFGRSLTNNTIFWIIAFLVAVVAVFYVYKLLRSRLSKEKAALIENIKSGNEQLKAELSGHITNKADDLRSMFTAEIQSNNEQINHRFNKANEELRNDLKANLKLATDAFDEQKTKLENQLKRVEEEIKKEKGKIVEA